MILPDALPTWLAGGAAATAALLDFAATRAAGPRRESTGGALLFLAVGIVLGDLLGRLDRGIHGLILPGDLYALSGASLTLAGLFVGQFRRLPGLWSVIAAVASVFFFAAAGLRGQPAAGEPASRLVLSLHILFTLGAAGFLVLMGALASLYLLKERAMRRDPTGWGRRLPALDQIDGLQLRAMQMGFLLLTLGVAFGVLLLAVTRVHTARGDFLAVTTTGLWLLLGSLLYSRLWRGWRGHRLATASAGLIVLLLLTLVLAFAIEPLMHGQTLSWTTPSSA